MVKLYYAVLSCAEACFMAAHRAGLQHIEAVKIDLHTKKTMDGNNYLTIHPRGTVPLLLLDDGSQLQETACILLYLADQVILARPRTLFFTSPTFLHTVSAVPCLRPRASKRNARTVSAP